MRVIDLIGANKLRADWRIGILTNQDLGSSTSKHHIELAQASLCFFAVLVAPSFSELRDNKSARSGAYVQG